MNEEKQIELTEKCSFCREEIPKDATKCKHCGSDLRSWFKRHRIISAYLILSLIVSIIIFASAGIGSTLAFLFFANLILLGLGIIKPSMVKMESRKIVIKKLGLSFLALFILLGIASSNPSNTISPTSSNSVQAPGDIQKATNQEPKTNKIGDTVSVGNFSYVLKKVDQKNIVGNQYVTRTADGIYEIVNVVFRNNDKEARYADSTMFKLFDDQGRSFNYSVDATSAYTMANGDQYNLFLKQANPGLEIDGVLIFDIPKDAKGLKLEVSGGFGSPDKAYIELN